MKQVIAAIGLSLVVAGCAMPKPVTYSKPGGTEEQFRRDLLTCRQYGMQSAMANGLGGNMFVELAIQDEARECLRTLGYTAQ